MGVIRRFLGYASLGAAKVAAKRAWESESYITSTLSTAEAGMWSEAAKNWFEGEEFWSEENGQERISDRE